MITLSDVITAYGAKTAQELANIPEYVAVFGADGMPFEYKDNAGETHTVKVPSDAVFEQLEHYASWYMLTYNNIDPLIKFLKKLKAHISNKQHAYNRMLTALMAEYSPIENVEEHTDETIGHTGTVENTGDASTTYGAKTATAQDNAVTNTAYVNTWESNDDIKNGKNVGTGSTTTTSNASTDTSEHGNVETLDTQDALHRVRHGNIGITENTTMWLHELDARQRDNFVQLIVHGVVNEYGALCEGVF